MFGSRDKGNKAELEVAKMLETWWKQVEPDVKFTRIPLSGGWGNQTVRAGFRAVGDVMATSNNFPCTCEVKRREGWSPKTFVQGSKCPVWGWWLQAQREAKELSLEPMLWMRRNAERGKGSSGAVWIVLFRSKFVETLRERCEHFPFPDFVWNEGIVSEYGSLPVGYLSHRILEVDPKCLLASNAS